MSKNCFTVRILYRRSIRSFDVPTEDNEIAISAEYRPPFVAYFHSSRNIVQFLLRQYIMLLYFLFVQHWTWYTKLSHWSVYYSSTLPVPVTARSKAWVWCRSPVEIVVSNPTGGIDVCCECCVLSGKGLCDELITRPEESWLWYIVVGDLETSWRRCHGPLGAVAPKTNKQTNKPFYTRLFIKDITEFRPHIFLMHILRPGCTKRTPTHFCQQTLLPRTDHLLCSDATPYRNFRLFFQRW